MKTNEAPIPFEIPETIQFKWQKIIDIMARIVDVPSGLIMRVADTDIAVLISSQTDENPYIPEAKEHLKDS